MTGRRTSIYKRLSKKYRSDLNLADLPAINHELLEDICPKNEAEAKAIEGFKGTDNMSIIAIDLLWPKTTSIMQPTYRDLQTGTLEL